MKIATITCHDVYNYGASLQAYALQEYCHGLGCDYEIINYKPDYLSQHYKLWTMANQRYGLPGIKQLYLLAKLPGRLLALRKKRKFDDFTSRYLHLTPERYDSYEALAANPPQADLYVAGSDQIWNTFFKNGHDRAFYLDFAPASKRRISYAASFATDRIHGGAEDFVKKQLANLDAISVRESSALALLNSLGYNGAKLVCDPVFLLSAQEWERLAGCAAADGSYIALYDCEKSKTLRDIALRLKERTGLPLHSVSSTAGSYPDKNNSLGGPLEFLCTIIGARYVLANSFHALAFSLIFRKDFFIANRSESINTRMRDFLTYLDLSDRLISSPAEITCEPIDYASVSPKLTDLIQTSKQFIQTQAAYAYQA